MAIGAIRLNFVRETLDRDAVCLLPVLTVEAAANDFKLLGRQGNKGLMMKKGKCGSKPKTYSESRLSFDQRYRDVPLHYVNSGVGPLSVAALTRHDKLSQLSCPSTDRHRPTQHHKTRANVVELDRLEFSLEGTASSFSS